MVQTYIFLCLSLCAAVSGYSYTDDEYREIDNRLEACLKTVPETYHFGVLDAPGTDCKYSAGLYKVSDGVEKELLTDLIAECLVDRGVDADSVNTARQCLVKRLAQDLNPAPTVKSLYTASEMAEIKDRMATCVDWVEADDVSFAFTTAGNDCRHMAGEYNLDHGVAKENLTDLIAECLRNQGVNAGNVETARQCLSESLARDLGMDKLPYTDYQIQQIDVRLVKCLDPVPDITAAGYLCRYWGLDQLRAGVQRHDLPAAIVTCLSGRGVDSASVSTAQQCMSEALPKDLYKEPVQECLYTDDQIDELEVRLADCLDVIPGNYHSCTTGYNRCWDVPGDTCRGDAGVEKLKIGYRKEALTDEIVGCLDSRGVEPADVATARECLAAGLAKDLVAE